MNICFDRKCLKGLVRHKVDFQGYKDILMEKNRILKKTHRKNEKNWLVILFIDHISLGMVVVPSPKIIIKLPMVLWKAIL